MKVCPVCSSARWNDDVRFCHLDGAKLRECISTCQCGHGLTAIDKFCEMCGRAVEEARAERVERAREQHFDIRSGA